MYVDYKEVRMLEEQTQRADHLFVCSHCLMAIESREGNQAILKHYVDEDDDVESKCDWCEEHGFDHLYELV